MELTGSGTDDAVVDLSKLSPQNVSIDYRPARRAGRM
jgi:hypothetical protein